MQFSGFGVLFGLQVFSNFGFGFRFFTSMMAVFGILLSNAFYGFSGFAKEVHLAVTLLKLQFQWTTVRVRGMHENPVPFSYLGANSCQVAWGRYVG